jgi:hypothetical protein
MISSYITTDDQEHLSVKYENLYAINGVITYLTTDSNTNPPHVTKFMSMYHWRPEIKVFNTEEQIQEYLNTFENKQEVELSVIGDNLWYGNIGHSLFDSLYPVYLALVKFGYQDNPFVWLVSDWSNKQTMSYDVITKFSGNLLMEYPHLDKSKLIHFKTLVAGTGNAGCTVVNQEYSMYGGKYDAIRLYKERMLNAYNLQIDKPINERLKIIIIDNKRYSDYEKSVIDQVINHFQSTADIKYVDWARHYNHVFADQMKELEDTDIYISGPGTGIVYMPFIKKGAVTINLGYMEHTQTNTIRPNIKIEGYPHEDWIFPGWLDQPLCSSVDYVSTLYYDRMNYNNLEFEPLTSIINNAISILRNKEILENKHNTDALVFKEYCKRVNNARELCNHLTGIAFFIELFVNEHPQTVPSHLVNIELLRQIKDELGYNRKYEYKI